MERGIKRSLSPTAQTQPRRVPPAACAAAHAAAAGRGSPAPSPAARAPALADLRSGDPARAAAGAAVLAELAAAGDVRAYEVADEPGALEALVAAVQAGNPAIAPSAAAALCAIVQKCARARGMVAGTEGAVPVLAAAFVSGGCGPTGAAALSALQWLTVSSNEAAEELIGCEGVLAALGAAVAQPVLSHIAAYVLQNMASCGSEMRRRMAADTDLLSSLAAAMLDAPATAHSSGGGEDSDNKMERDQVAKRAIQVVSDLGPDGEAGILAAMSKTEGMLSVLATLLPVPGPVGDQAARLLNKIGETGNEMLAAMAETPGMLPGLVLALRRDGDAHSDAAGALGEIARGSPELRGKVERTPGALNALAAGLRKHEANAAWCVYHLAHGAGPEGKRRLAETPRLLASLVAPLTSAWPRSLAVTALREIASGGDDLAAMVASEVAALLSQPAAVAKLSEAAKQGDADAAWAIVQIARATNGEDTVQVYLEHAAAIPAMLSGLAAALRIQQHRNYAAHALSQIVKVNDTLRALVVGTPDMLESLAAAVQAEDQHALWTVYKLASEAPDGEAKAQLADGPGLLAALVAALRRPGACSNAAAALGEIASGSKKLQGQVAATPGVAEGLTAAARNNVMAGWALRELGHCTSAQGSND